MPAVFVLLWSTGFIGAKLGSPFAPPFTFLLLRFAVVVAALTLTAFALGAPWPRGWEELRRIALVGVLIHAAYLGGVFLAISVGVPAGIAALIVSLQPLATAIVSDPIWASDSATGSGWALFWAFSASPSSSSTNSPGEGPTP